MASSLRLFQFFQTFYQSNQTCCQLNPKKCIYLICLVQFSIESVSFLLFEARSLFDYGMTIYLLISFGFSMGTFLLPEYQMKYTLEFIEYCKGFMENSKLSLNLQFPCSFVINELYFCCRAELNDRL